MRSAAIDLRDLVEKKLKEKNIQGIDFSKVEYGIGYDLSKIADRDDALTFIDIQGKGPEPFSDNTEYPVAQAFFNLVGDQKINGMDGYERSTLAAQEVKKILHRFNSWQPINGAIYSSVLENTSVGYLDTSEALHFPLLSTNYECQRRPFFIDNRFIYSDLIGGYSYSIYEKDTDYDSTTVQELTTNDNSVTDTNNPNYGKWDTTTFGVITGTYIYRATHDNGYYYEAEFTV